MQGVNHMVADLFICLAKAFNLYLPHPPHKWDGNELKIHCRWL